MNYLQKKRLALMHGGRFKGYMRNVSGYPLTLTDCLGNRLAAYEIYGNCIQDGTPSIDNPVEVQSVGDYDEVSGKYVIPVTVKSMNEEKQTYSIYLDEPLRSIDGNSDYIMVNVRERNAVRVSNIQKICLDGQSAEISLYGVFTNVVRFCHYSPYNIHCKLGGTKVLSDELPFVLYFLHEGEAIFAHTRYSNHIYISVNKERFGYEDGDSKSVIVNKATEYFKANPITAYYQLTAPIETDITSRIDWNNIPKTYKGTSIITVGTSVTPSSMEIKYYSEREGE